MKTLALTLITSAAVFAQTAQSPAATHPAEKHAGRSAAKTLAAQKSAPVKADAPVTKIPEGAKLVQPNLYRYTDSDGKTWMYRQTPFGISRWPDTPNAAPQPAAAPPPVSVTDLGDSVRFERKTAFGKSQWVRKKSDLTAEEKALLADQQKDGQQKDGQVKAAPADNKASERQ